MGNTTFKSRDGIDGVDGADAVIGPDVIDVNELDPKFKGRSSITALDIDWNLDQVRTKTLTVNTVFTFSNLYIGVKTLEIDGNFTLGFPLNFSVIGTYDGTVLNLVEIECTDAVNLTGWVVITPTPAI